MKDLDRLILRAAMVAALNKGKPVSLSDENARRAAYERAELVGWDDWDDWDAVRVALIERIKIAPFAEKHLGAA